MGFRCLVREEQTIEASLPYPLAVKRLAYLVLIIDRFLARNGVPGTQVTVPFTVRRVTLA